jgi:branched-subunit amino acid aminotransferase/4-amino-4-deoxychorismate lyase
MSEQLAYFDGSFVPVSQVTIHLEDLGFTMGVAVSERLRTFGGKLFRVEEHLQRLRRSLEIVHLVPQQSLERTGQIAAELVAHNHPLLQPGDDLGLSLFVTPGRSGSGQPPVVGIYSYPLPFAQWASDYDRGQRLTETGIRQVPSNCWPAELKCRSRMHYYLADLLADEKHPGSRAILLDQDGFVSEASTANIVLYTRDQSLLSPPSHKILPGVSLSVMTELADQLGIRMHHGDFRLEQVAAADEVLLCSTSPCVWSVVELNGQPVSNGTPGPLARQLLAAWSELVGLDIREQALQFAKR